MGEGDIKKKKIITINGNTAVITTTFKKPESFKKKRKIHVNFKQ